MDEVVCGDFRGGRAVPWSRDHVRIVSWNIERGLQFPRVLDFLKAISADLILLQEVDWNARRTRYRDVAGELACALHLNYAFGNQFRELSEGSDAAPAYHGLATLSPWPLANARIIRFRHQSNFWAPRWYVPRMRVFQRRLGARIALVAEARVYGRTVVTHNLHLESRGSDDLRIRQLQDVLDDCRNYSGGSPLVVAGDFNLDAGGPVPAHALRQAGLRDAVGLPGHPTAALRSLSKRERPIDWIFVSDHFESTGRVHRDVRASDHFPISATVRMPKSPIDIVGRQF